MASSLDDVLARVERGDVKLSELDSILGNANLAVLARRLFIEKYLGIPLTGIASNIIDFEALRDSLSGVLVGAIQVPLHALGPLVIEGGFLKGRVYIPLALSSDRDVALLDALIEALNEKGGVSVRVQSVEFKALLLSEDSELQVVDALRAAHSTLSSVRVTELGRLAGRRALMLEAMVRLQNDESSVIRLRRAISQLGYRGYALVDSERVYELRVSASTSLEPLLERAEGAELVASLEKRLELSPAVKHLVSKIAARLAGGFFKALGLDSARLEFSRDSVTLAQSREALSLRAEAVSVHLPERDLELALRLPTQREALALLGITRADEEALFKLAESASALVVLSYLAPIATFFYEK
ncbi:MAG: hypothetical protein QXS85_00315 [Acidilobaceae archaeon]